MHRGRVRLLANACVMVRTCGPWLHGGVLDGSSLRSPAPTIPRSHDGHMARHQLSTHLLANSLPAYQWWLNFVVSVRVLQSIAVKVLSQTAL